MKSKKGKILSVLGVLLVIAIAGGLIYYTHLPTIEFHHNQEKIEVHSEYDAKKFIKKIRDHKEDDVQIDTSKVNIDKLGQYNIIYTIDNKEYSLEVDIIDTTAPNFDISDLEVDLGSDISPEQFVKNIQDETEVKLKFKDEYDLTRAGVQQVTIVAEDEAGNKTEKTAQLTIVKDEEKPTLSGLHTITITKGQKINYLSGIKAKDNRDPEPKIEVNSSQVNTSKVGTYEVQYTVTDRSGNQNTYKEKVVVNEKQSVSTKAPTGNKVVYLTFDDGPSSNTAKILNILDKYNAKATFFVTGNGQKYNYLIKQAHDKGHTIGLHTYTHSYSKIYSSVDAYFADLNKIGDMVKGQIGYVPHYIRFPGGASNTVSRHYSKGIMSKLVVEVQNRGFQYYDWNASTGDASGNNVAVSKLIREGTASHANNVMILAHDTAAKSTTVQALPQIIEHYQALGYTFKGIDDNTFTPHQHVNN
ncbi:MAG: polysaccharide deacetylase family protein [Longibaculum sp.]